MTDNTKTFLGLGALGAILAWLLYDKDETPESKTIDTTAEVIEEPKELSGIKKKPFSRKEIITEAILKNGQKVIIHTLPGADSGLSNYQLFDSNGKSMGTFIGTVDPSIIKNSKKLSGIENYYNVFVKGTSATGKSMHQYVVVKAKSKKDAKQVAAKTTIVDNPVNITVKFKID